MYSGSQYTALTGFIMTMCNFNNFQEKISFATSAIFFLTRPFLRSTLLDDHTSASPSLHPFFLLLREKEIERLCERREGGNTKGSSCNNGLSPQSITPILEGGVGYDGMGGWCKKRAPVSLLLFLLVLLLLLFLLFLLQCKM